MTSSTAAASLDHYFFNKLIFMIIILPKAKIKLNSMQADILMNG